MLSQRKGGLSTVTQVKVLSPEIDIIALGQGFRAPEASIAVCVRGEYDSGVPGSESTVGNRTVCTGTWENHTAPAQKGRFQQAEEVRRKYSGMVVGLTHSRGVVGVMPDESLSSLEGVSSKVQRSAKALAVL